MAASYLTCWKWQFPIPQASILWYIYAFNTEFQFPEIVIIESAMVEVLCVNGYFHLQKTLYEVKGVKYTIEIRCFKSNNLITISLQL